ncbi:methyl-accepting chemotaxis protein [Vibrio fluvialis]|uniref:methyl-accepting chemotaxis protein n=1 Tax=Vibrio fluvialis TaxID=676 RepID=UPI0012AD52D3|nr:methyl-accepting chemotaxis protein [Vibrio fluvialis]
MRTAINTCLTLLLLFTAFLAVPVFADDDKVCPIGDIPINKFPLGTSLVYSACFDGCRAENGWQTDSGFQYVWSCGKDGTDFCTGHFTTTGESCTGQDDTNGSCDANGDCSPTPEDGTDPTDELDPNLVSYDVACGSYFYDYGNTKGWNGKCDGTLYVPDYTQPLNNIKNTIEEARQLSFGNSAKLDTLSESVTQLSADTAQKLTETEENLSKKIDELSVQVENVDLSDLDPKFSELKSSLSSLNGMSNYYFNAIMGNVSGLSGNFSQVNSNINGVSGQLNTLYSSLNSQMSSVAASVNTANGNITTLSGDVAALSSQVSELSGSLDGLGDVDLSGVESKLQGIQETLDGNGLVGRPFEGQVDFEGNGLYGSDAIEKLEGEIDQLQEQYQEQMGQFKSLFTFDESQLNTGEYVKHEWTFTFANGRTNSFSSGVFPALLQNANFIAAVLLFLAVLLGIKALTD